MVKKLTNKMLGIFTMLLMLMMTSLSAHATYVLKGSFNDWGEGMAMLQDGDTWTLTKDFAVGEEFKFQEDGTWVGAQADGSYYGVTSSVLNNGTLITLLLDAGQNLRIETAGRYTIVIDANRKMRIGTKAPVTVKTGIQNGNVAVNPTQALPGETITITATPDPGYYVEIGNVKVEKTVNGDVAQAPGLKADGPGVGQFVTDIQAGEAPNTFTFAMPESPYGAKVSAEFQACIPITAAMIQPNPIPDQDYTGSQIKPAIVVMDGETTLVEGTDYTLEYGANVEPGEGTIIVTGKGKYTSTVTVTFTIKKGVHNVNVTSDGNGTVAAEPLSAVQGTDITLTITPNEGYELDKLTVGGTEVTVTGNTYTFEMPDADVAVNATFKKVDYTITVTSNEYGTVTVNDNKTTANFGDNITLTITPKEDCVLQELKVDGQVVEVEGNTYTFTMPSHNVAVEATFRALDVSYWVVWGITPENSNSWASENWIKMTSSGDNYVLADQDMAAFSEFKIVKKVQDGENDPDPVKTWYGAEGSNLYWITAQKLGEDIDLFPNGNYQNMYFPKDGTFTFTFTPATANANAVLVVTGKFIYKVTIGETANGTVTANPTSGKQGDEITLTIAPNDGYEVGNISVTYVDGDNTVEVPVTDNKFNMPAGDVTVNVTFNAKTYNITVAESTNGKVTAPESAACGSTVTLIVEPDEDCVLQSLTVTYGENNTPVEVNNNQFTMPAGNVTVTATFRKLDVSYWVVWGITPENSNSWASENWIPMEQDGANYVLADQDMAAFSEFKIVKKVQDGENDPNPVETWYGAEGNNLYWITLQKLGENIDLFPNGNYINLYIPSDGTFTFTFTPSTKTLVVTGAFEYNITYENTENGTVTGPAKALNGNTVELTVTPADDTYLVGTVSITYVLNGENKTVEVTKNEETGKYTFTMPAADVTVAVTFTKILTNNPLTWNVANASLEVKVDNAAIQSGTEVEEGKEVKVTISQTEAQAAEWEMGKVTIVYGTTTTELTLADGVYTFEMPAAATEIKVEFTAVQHNITVTPNDYVTVVVDPTTAAAGQEVTITVTPNDDFVVTGVTVNDGDVEVTDNGDGTYTFDMPTGANGVTIDVTVAAKIQGVSFTADRNWATYIGAYDLVKPAGVEAIYVVTGVQGNAVVIESVDYIPAGKGVLLYSETAGENLVAELYAGDKDETISTKLVGNATAATNVTTEDYVLYDNNFIRSQGGSVAAHRCYLPGTQVQGAPRMLKIGYDGDVPTAIETLMAEGNVANVMYVNMSGLTSDKPFRGINIAVVTFNDGTTQTLKFVK